MEGILKENKMIVDTYGTHIEKFTYRHCDKCQQPIPDDYKPDKKYPTCEYCTGLKSRQNKKRYEREKLLGNI